MATRFSEFETNVSENVLYLSYKEETAKGDTLQELQHQLLYRIKGGKDESDAITLIENGEPAFSILHMLDRFIKL